MSILLRRSSYLVLSTKLQLCPRPAMMSSAAGDKRIKLGGIYPPLTTPFQADESIAYDQLAANLDRYARIPFAGVVVLGSNGEYPFLEREEKLQLVKFVRENVKGKPVIAGSGCESTKATIKLTEDMAKLGINAVMVVTPSYYKGQMQDAAMIAHYTAVADASPIPVILYSVPGNTGIDLSVDAIRHLAGHPNIIGLKDSGGDVTRIGTIVRQTRGQDFEVLAGSASFLLPAYLVGAVGGVCALANVLGGPLCQLHALHSENKFDKDLQRRFIEPNTMVTKRYGVAGMKAALDIFGYHGGRNRAPMQPVSAEARQHIKQTFINNGFVPEN